MTRRRKLLVHSRADVPDFASDEEERAFWDGHEHADDFFDNAPQAPEAMLPAALREYPVAVSERDHREGSQA
jgi:hypothetical protein